MGVGHLGRGHGIPYLLPPAANILAAGLPSNLGGGEGAYGEGARK